MGRTTRIREEEKDKRSAARSEHRASRRKHYDDNDEEEEERSSRRHRHRRHRTKSRSGSVDETQVSRQDEAPTERKERSKRHREDDKGLRSPEYRSSPRSSHRHHRSSRARSRSPKREHRSVSRSRSPIRRSNKPLPSQEESYRGREEGSGEAVEKPVEKQKPNFKNTGLLAADTNKVSVGTAKTTKTIVLKYHEPAEARKPPSSDKWILYIFKGASQEPLDTIALHSRSCWLLGREPAVADIPTDHPSCSKQHAVFQFRHTVKKDEWGDKKDAVGLYVLDLESANGTFLNGEQIEAARYVQCMTGDMIKFGESSREYVILLPPKE